MLRAFKLDINSIKKSNNNTIFKNNNLEQQFGGTKTWPLLQQNIKILKYN